MNLEILFDDGNTLKRFQRWYTVILWCLFSVQLNCGPMPLDTYKELTTATLKMMSGKVVGADDTPNEFWRICGPVGRQWPSS